MAKLDLPYVAWRDGRPRFKPSGRERAAGFQDLDLRHDDRPGEPWFTLDEAHTWAHAKLAEIRASRAAGTRAPKQKPAPAGRDVAELLEQWLASDEVKALAPKTREGYRKTVDTVLWKPAFDKRTRATLEAAALERGREEFSRKPIEAIGAPELRLFFNYARKARGLHSARAAIAVISAAWSWGRMSTVWRLAANPRIGLELEQPEARIVIYTDAEIRALVAAADASGRGSIGDATILGLGTGQRQGDRLALEDAGLVGGRRRFRQSKTAAIVEIPETPWLKARLEAARVRAAAIALELGVPAERRAPTIIVDETTGRPFNEHTFRHVFADVRELAVKGSNELALAPCPSLADKRDQDLRDTAVTWLARAGCTLPEIASITGHSLRSIHNILQHYLAITPELADAAIGKLVAWMDREGMVV